MSDDEADVVWRAIAVLETAERKFMSYGMWAKQNADKPNARPDGRRVNMQRAQVNFDIAAMCRKAWEDLKALMGEAE